MLLHTFEHMKGDKVTMVFTTMYNYIQLVQGWRLIKIMAFRLGVAA